MKSIKSWMKVLKTALIILAVVSIVSCKANIETVEVIDYEDSENVGYNDRAPIEKCLGYKNIPENQSFKSAVTSAKYIYYIDYEFDLGGQSVKIPEGSILSFGKDGSIKNGKIEFNNTYLDGNVSFSNVGFSGNLLNKYVTLSWFGPNKTAAEEKSNKRKNADLISELFSVMGDTLIVDLFCPMSSYVYVETNINMRAIDWDETKCTKDYNYTYEPQYGFYTVEDNSLFILNNTDTKKSGSMNLFGIYLKGNPDKFKNATTLPSGVTWGVFLPWGGSLAAVYNCKFEGFTQGVRALGGYLEKFQNTTFTNCKVGVYALYASDFDVFGCKFTNCMPNLSVPDQMTIDETAVDSLRCAGTGFISEGCGMLNFANNLLENNFVNFMINEASIIVNITDCTFKNPGFCDIYVYNDYQGYSTEGYLSLGLGDLQKFCIDNVVIHNNTFTRTAKAKGESVVFLRNRDRALQSGKTVTTDKRVTNLVFSNNKVTDNRSGTSNKEAIFMISNVNETKSQIVCTGNNFTSSKAKYFASLFSNSSGQYAFKNSSNSMPSGVSETSKYNDDSSVIVFLPSDKANPVKR